MLTRVCSEGRSLSCGIPEWGSVLYLAIEFGWKPIDIDYLDGKSKTPRSLEELAQKYISDDRWEMGQPDALPLAAAL